LALSDEHPYKQFSFRDDSARAILSKVKRKMLYNAYMTFWQGNEENFQQRSIFVATTTKLMTHCQAN
jgi:hypothetical protein